LIGERIRIAVIGVGYWGPNLVRNLVESPQFDVVSVCDRRPQALEPIARRYPGIPLTERYEEVLRDGNVDAVAIATPVSSHHPLGMSALQAGKHVFVEKPLAVSSEEAIELTELAEAHGLVLMPGHTFLYSPSVTTIKSLIDSGDLGEIYFISSSRVNLGLHQPDVSVVWDLGPHDFSILRYWMNELPSQISALSRSCIIDDLPDVAFINLGFPSGAIANVELSWLAPSKLRRTAVVGSKKMVVYEDGAAEAIKIFDRGVEYKDPETFGEYHLSYRAGDVLSPHLSNEEPLTLQIDDFVRAIRFGEQPEHGLALARDVVRLAEAAEASLEHGGEKVVLGGEELLGSAR
jgi:predicted dehydrogenase